MLTLLIYVQNSANTTDRMLEINHFNLSRKSNMNNLYLGIFIAVIQSTKIY